MSKETDSTGDETISDIASHPIFEGVRKEDLGRSFAYSRGYHPAPEEAEVLVTLSGGEPAMYVVAPARAAPS
ncbi:MAG: hypothetical protein M3N18_02740 [Actinomycetota bacterium]|nr:hypothetical protein [Actinomycetota bacterium]